MDILVYLIPMALVMGGLWLAGFMWALKSKQFDDPEGAANRILLDDDNDIMIAKEQDRERHHS